MYLNSSLDIPSRARCLEGAWKGERLQSFLFIVDLYVFFNFRPRTHIPMLMPHPVRRFSVYLYATILIVFVFRLCALPLWPHRVQGWIRELYFLVTWGLTYFEPSSTTLSFLVSPEVMSFLYSRDLADKGN